MLNLCKILRRAASPQVQEVISPLRIHVTFYVPRQRQTLATDNVLRHAECSPGLYNDVVESCVIRVYGATSVTRTVDESCPCSSVHSSNGDCERSE